MLEPIQDNDNYKPQATNYSNLSMFTQESVTERQTDGRIDSRYYYIPSPLLRGDNKVVLSTPCHNQDIKSQNSAVICSDCIGRWNSDNRTIMDKVSSCL